MITKKDIASVKGRGFLLNRGTENFSGRAVSVAGKFSAEQLAALAECAKRFGNGNVIFTTRLCAEVQGIPFDKIPEAEAFMAEKGLPFGGTGAKIRPVTACKGTTCVYGNIDTAAMAKVIHDRFYVGMKGVSLPHKFKIGVGGCPNSCMKPSLNDVGIEGVKVFAFSSDLCKNCRACAVLDSCPVGAVKKEDSKVILDREKCISCGVCLGKCPFGAVPKEAEGSCIVYVGGTWGKSRRLGTPLKGYYSPESIPDVIEAVMLWYKENGFAKERLGACIDRLGIDSLEAAIADGALLERRDTILSAPIKERT